MLAIIGGSGLRQFPGLQTPERRVVRTPYGEPSGALTLGKLAGRDVMFIARHGYGHTLAPHQINYRANIWALHAQGAHRVVAVATVGGITSSFSPGTLAVPDQIIDYTHGRETTYFAEPNHGVTHIDFTHPYNDEVRRDLLRAAQSASVSIHDGGVYGCTQGPRLETVAEIRRLARDGCDMVGMTGMPEAALARELGLSYAAVAAVVNHAAGVGDSAAHIDLGRAEVLARDLMERVMLIIKTMVNDGG
jgi:5'-deoxy-5'-methylthioadenosine phosphorylase